MLNLATLLENSAIANPQKEAVIFGEQIFTFEQINKAANQVANGLKNIAIKT